MIDQLRDPQAARPTCFDRLNDCLERQGRHVASTSLPREPINSDAILHTRSRKNQEARVYDVSAAEGENARAATILGIFVDQLPSCARVAIDPAAGAIRDGCF